MKKQIEKKRKNKVLKFFTVLAASFFSLFVLGALAFYLLVVVGLSPRLQTIWVCSAMRTMEHQYLATSIIPMETIERIMTENAVDDSGYDSEILTFHKKDNVESTDLLEQAQAEESEHETDASLETETTASTEETETAAPAEETEALPMTEETVPDPTNSLHSLQVIRAEAFGDFVVAASEHPQKEEHQREEMEKAEKETEAESESETEALPEFGLGDYESEGYELLEDGIYLKSVSGIGWRGYVMLISNPLQVKLVDTSQQFSCGENVMTMVTDSGAIAGINGGGFQDGVNYDSNGGMPAGLLIENGELIYPFSTDDAAVYNMIGINMDGALVLRHCTASWALENGIVSAVSFSPFLIVNGEGMIKTGSGGWGIAPRTAIGQRITGEILFLVIDGRQVDWSLGCDLDVLQSVMLGEQAYNAAMLDGGSSTAMVYDGRYINRPSLGHERWINNCFAVFREEEE